MALGTLGHGAGRKPKAASGRAIRLGEDESHVVPGEHDRLEGGDREGWRAGEDDAQGRQAALRWRFFSLARIRFCLSSERCSTKTRPVR